MAASEYPIVIEPPTGSGSSSPGGGDLANSSPVISVDSSPSSGPGSTLGSNTAQSEPPSPLEDKNRSLTDATTLAPPPTPPTCDHLPENTLHDIVDQGGTGGGNSLEIPRSVPGETAGISRDVGPSNMNATSWYGTPRKKLSQMRWLGQLLNILSLVTALWLGVRMYKLAVWSSHNDHLQTCLQFIQANRTPPLRCKKALDASNIPIPPYQYLWSKKAINDSLGKVSTLGKRAVHKALISVSNGPAEPLHTSHFLSVGFSAIIIFIVLALGFLWVRFESKPSEDSAPYTSPAPRHEWQLTRHYSEGPETVHEKGVMIHQKPHDDDYPHSMVRRLSASHDDETNEEVKDHFYWPSSNDSANTLVAPRQKDAKRPSNASILDKSANEKHENLIELEFNGKTRVFFKPETGDFIHLKPWKSTHNPDDDSDDEERMNAKADEKRSIHKAIGKMIAGDTSFGTGKHIEEKVAEGIEKANVGLEHVGIRHRIQPPQNWGDSLVEVSRE